jgi:hypothetical protein
VGQIKKGGILEGDKRERERERVDERGALVR